MSDAFDKRAKLLVKAVMDEAFRRAAYELVERERREMGVAVVTYGTHNVSVLDSDGEIMSVGSTLIEAVDAVRRVTVPRQLSDEEMRAATEEARELRKRLDKATEGME